MIARFNSFLTIHKGDHSTKVIESKEFKKRRMEIKYWLEVARINKRKVEYFYAKKEKTWNSINGHL